MTLDGEHRFSASQAHVWERLNDPEVLARATPGLKELQPLQADIYKAVFEIKMGPINSTFDGTLQVVDRVAPERFGLLIKIGGKVGSVDAEATIALRPEEGATVVAFTGTARLTGLLMRMGQRVLGGVGRMFTRQFFQAVEQELETT